jgi:hypothetical protein
MMKVRSASSSSATGLAIGSAAAALLALRNLAAPEPGVRSVVANGERIRQ